MEAPDLEIELLAAFKDVFAAGSPEERAKGLLRKSHGLDAQEADNVLKRLKNRNWLVYGKPDSPLRHTPIRYSMAGVKVLKKSGLW